MRKSLAAVVVIVGVVIGLMLSREPATAPATPLRDFLGLEADAPAEPFQVGITCTIVSSPGCGNTRTRVPAGKRFIIQTVSGWARTTARVPMNEFRLTLTSTRIATFYFSGRVATAFPSGTIDTVADARQVRLYADPNTALTMGAFAASNTSGSVFVSVSGYLVPVP